MPIAASKTGIALTLFQEKFCDQNGCQWWAIDENDVDFLVEKCPIGLKPGRPITAQLEIRSTSGGFSGLPDKSQLNEPSSSEKFSYVFCNEKK